MVKAFLSVIQAFLFIVSSFSVTDSNFKERVDLAAVKLSSETDFAFDGITAEKMKISESEKTLCREWYEKNILTGDLSKVAYNFTVGGKSLRNNPDKWDVRIGDESKTGEVYKGGKTSYITLTHKTDSLSAEVEATVYEESATCEWTVYIKNNGNENSPVIKNFYGADTVFDIKDGELYFSKGSAPDSDDFELYKSFINTMPMKFSANGGRSESFLPFFNFCGSNYGIVVSVGWTGQWCVFANQNGKGIKFRAKQEEFNAYLEPGEEIRSPLVSVSFYDGENPLKGFNTLRHWETVCVCPDSIRPLNGYVIANEFSTLTTDDFIKMIDNINPETLKNTDYFWMDAGWYKYSESWSDGVGNWIPDSSRFSEGLKPLGEKIASTGKRFLLWYEPERVREDTYLYNEGMNHNGWIVQINGDLLWNLANGDACEFLSDYIGKSLVENGVTMYRQDFNFSPLIYWQKADKMFYNKRKGICENHYVSNLYKYLDSLCESVDGLIIDNCASGGKRLDIEMIRRSLPLWRSDYNCGNADGTVKEDVLEATQAMTYGLSCWIPYSGTNRYFHSEYASRSAILTNQSVYEPDVIEYSKYAQVSKYMTENYYPLTYGGLKTDRFLAMQFGSDTEGAALIYKRENVKSDSYVLKLNGLNPEKMYDIYDIDNPENVLIFNGSQLMSDGFILNIPDTPKAVVVMYKPH